MKKYLFIFVAIVVLMGAVAFVFLRSGGMSPEERAEIQAMADEIRTEYPYDQYPHIYERLNTRDIPPDYHQQFPTVAVKQNDYEVRVSWPEPLSITDHGNGHVVRVQNEADEETLLLWKTFRGSLWEDLGERLNDDEALFIQTYLGGRVTSSNYNMRKAWLEVTVEDIERAKSVEEAVAVSRLVLLALDYDDPYAFDLGHIRGFVFPPSHIEIYTAGDDSTLYQISGNLDSKGIHILVSSFRVL